jgi:predicted metal-dependent phosphoesterase TrpH
MPRVDLHTHSQASPDGALSLKHYQQMLSSGKLDAIAITDHNRIDFAQHAQSELGSAIIIGEEILAREGEIIGLYLTENIPAGLNATDTVKRIRAQGGIVYIPHPFETVRKGLPLETLNHIAPYIDIVETYNGRSFQNRSDHARTWALEHKKPWASSSDAHGWRGWGNTASVIMEHPSKHSLLHLLSMAAHDTTSTGIVGRLYPKLNALRKQDGHA